jgi:hypothetical protein
MNRFKKFANDNDLDFDPRQKFAPLDDWIAKHEHTLPMKKENTKPNFKIRRIK